MPHPTSDSTSTPDPRLSRSLWQWLCLGMALTLCIPAARGDSAIGPLPFWLLAAPLLGLLVAYRHRLLAAWRRRSHGGRGQRLLLH